MTLNSERYGLVKGEECSYVLNVADYEEGELIEIEVLQMRNTNLQIYEGYDALLVGESTTIGSTDKFVQFTGAEPLFLSAYFTSDNSSFRLEFIRKFQELTVED